ncbi:MAG: SgcJ/EcaC family oxidoreductase [Janthinobacterium lividum]
MRPTCYPLVLAVAFLSSSFAGLAQSPSDDEAQIRSIVQSEADAWNRGDAEAFGAHYAEDGHFTNVIGQQLYGRKAFIAQHASIFNTIYKGSHNVFSVSKITFLRPDVALVDIDGTLSGAIRMPPGLRANDDGTMHVKLLEIMTRERGAWLIAAFHNVAVSPLPPGGPPK